MKGNDYFRLANISLKSRRKSTHQTIRGMSFGLILLMPVLFLTGAFFIDLSSKANKDPSLRAFNIDMVSQNIEEYNVSVMNKEYEDDFITNTQNGFDGQDSLINYVFDDLTYTPKNSNSDSTTTTTTTTPSLTTVEIEGNAAFKLPISEEEVTTNGQTKKYKSYKCIQAFDTTVSGNNVFSKGIDYSIENPFIYGSGFSEKSKGEILISDYFTNGKFASLNQDIIGKKITVRSTYVIGEVSNLAKDKSSLQTSYSEGELNFLSGQEYIVLNEYIIKGVFDHKLYDNSIRRNTLKGCSSSGYGMPTFIVSFDSIKKKDGTFATPSKLIYTNESGDNKWSNGKILYPSDKSPIKMNNENISDGLCFLPLGLGVGNLNINPYGDSCSSCIYDHTRLIHLKDFYYAKSTETIISDYMTKSTNYSGKSTISVNPTSYSTFEYQTYNLLYTIFFYLIMGLLIFGAVIFFATCLNLYNSISFSVKSRTNYLGLLRAIGMRGKDVKRQYFTEILIIFLWVFLWTILIGGGLCVGIKFGIDAIYNIPYIASMMSMMPFKISLNLIYLPAAIGVLIVIAIIISIVFTLIACKDVSRKPLLELLIDDK